MVDILIIWRHDVLRFVGIRSVDSRRNVTMITRWFIEPRLLVVVGEQMFPVVGHVMGEVVVLGTVLFDKLHVLQFHRMIVLERKVVVNLQETKLLKAYFLIETFHLVWIIRNVSGHFNFVCDSSVKPSIVKYSAHDVLLIINDLLS